MNYIMVCSFLSQWIIACSCSSFIVISYFYLVSLRSALAPHIFSGIFSGYILTNFCCLRYVCVCPSQEATHKYSTQLYQHLFPSHPIPSLSNFSKPNQIRLTPYPSHLVIYSSSSSILALLIQLTNQYAS